MALTQREAAIVMGIKDKIKHVKTKLARIYRETGLEEVKNAKKELDEVDQMVAQLINGTPQPACAVPFTPLP